MIQSKALRTFDFDAQQRNFVMRESVYFLWIHFDVSLVVSETFIMVDNWIEID